ncbi:hypothetical protein [Streptomyces sp. NPDC057623]|uniref:hypothetical protein n=1 Tax=Streptomyces sp. NPDC057623 TaxID=3346187 RepID=UPI0036B03350
MATDADLVLVVGSRNSPNSQRLMEFALNAGTETRASGRNAENVDPAWLREATTVGLTSGASAPEILVEEVRPPRGGSPAAGPRRRDSAD